MTIQEAIAKQKDALNIHQCGFVKTEDIPVSNYVRKLCAENACGCYNKTWACPPGVGTLEECAQKMRAYEDLFVFTTSHALEDSFDWEGMMHGREEHDKVVPKVAAFFQQYHKNIMVLSTEGCRKCAVCTYPSAPCRFPESLRPSIESYGVEVNRLAKLAGVNYSNGQNTVTYFSCIFFSPKPS